MRFELVTAHAFGPFRNQTLQLASGMNIVYGPNESGKSSWHAALHAGLCGVKNKKGPPTKQEKEFEKQRKPWHGDSWEVEAVVALADGRRVELRHDLAAKTGHAHDADVAGQDYSAEISDRGVPDGARWLGLSRASFLNTACVRQSEMLGVREGAHDLQDALTKAADKASEDVTAVTALQRLESYRKNRIGSQRAPKRPLRQAQGAVSIAKQRLVRAKQDLADYLRRQHEVATMEEQLAMQQRRIKAAHAYQATQKAEEASRRVRRVHELNQSLGDAPPHVSVDEDLAIRVAAAIAAWQAAPLPNEPRGDTCEVLRMQQLDTEKNMAKLRATKPRPRPKHSALLLGFGLLVGAGACFWVQTTVALLVAVICSIAGLGTIGRGFVNAKRKAAEDHAHQVTALRENLDDLESQIDRRHAEDLSYRKALDQSQAASEELRQAANEADIREPTTDALVAALSDWRKVRSQRISEQTRMWGQLQGELAGMTQEEVERDADAKQNEADTLRQDCDTEELEAAHQFVGNLPVQLKARERLQRQLDKAKGALELFAGNMASVADAEDDYEESKRRQHHLETLDQTLAYATKFIEDAQKDVYRVMADVLRRTLLEWLPQVTGRRYDDCRVDPKTLMVEVREAQGNWRDAGLLSHGTAEQIYLLLRLALCRHLVVESETCPLILDDPVSACDAHRKALVLETLLAVSAETQVILFTHDDDVRSWGHDHLSNADNSQVLELADTDEAATEPLGTRIANRFKGAFLTEPFEELRGGSIRPLDIP